MQRLLYFINRNCEIQNARFNIDKSSIDNKWWTQQYKELKEPLDKVAEEISKEIKQLVKYYFMVDGKKYDIDDFEFSTSSPVAICFVAPYGLDKKELLSKYNGHKLSTVMTPLYYNGRGSVAKMIGTKPVADIIVSFYMQQGVLSYDCD